MRNLLSYSAFALALALAATPLALAAKIQGTISTKELKKEQFVDAAKVTLAQAVEAALDGAPGKATEAELDDEDGFLVYEVKVVGADYRRAKVIVDAGSKAVLTVKQKK